MNNIQNMINQCNNIIEKAIDLPDSTIFATAVLLKVALVEMKDNERKEKKMITIEHTYCTHVEIDYRSNDDYMGEAMCADMDTIAEHVCEMLVAHNFTTADVCDANTGEVLMIITRS